MKLILFAMFVLRSMVAYSQASHIEMANNEMKYWKLRGRLTGDENNRDQYNGFLVVGQNNGEGIPAVQRHPTYKRNSYDFNHNVAGIKCTLQTLNNLSIYAQYSNGGIQTQYQPIIDPRDGKDVIGILRFGDNTLIEVGKYLTVLATEWALLKRENASTLQTEKEIYNALMAIDRLDLLGETIYGLSPNQNGFLMRNDVDKMFQLNSDGKNIDLTISSIACDDFSADCTESNATVHARNAMSQDEVVGLIMGFAIMRKMLPESASFNNVPFRQKSRELTERIINYVKKAGVTNFWMIVDPDQNKRVCRGSKAIWSSFALAAAAEYICGMPFQNGWSLSIGKLAWNFQKNHYAMNNWDIVWGLGMPTQMQADLNLNAYEYIDIPGNNSGNYEHQGAYNVTMFLKLLASSKTAPRPYPPYMDLTGKALINTVSQTYEKSLFELMGSVLYGYSPQISEGAWRHQFNLLTCGCNCIQGVNPSGYRGCDNYLLLVPPNIPQVAIIPPNPWMVEDRWAFYRHGGGSYPDVGSTPGDVPGTLNEFNGLDYMMAYNLYRWKYFAGGYMSKVRKIINGTSMPINFPATAQSPAFSIGSDQNPFENKAVFQIQSGNTTLESDAHVYYFAGSDIQLKPGFHAKPGAIFQAAIREYDCLPNQFLIGNTVGVGYKTEDSLNQFTYLDEIDTTINIQVDEDSALTYDAGPNLDSLYSLTYTNNVDTFIYGLNSGYVYSDSGEIIYAPQSNKNALQNASMESVRLYPNPVSSISYLEMTLYADSELSLSLTDEFGKKMVGVFDAINIQQSKGKKKFTLRTNHLASGIYYCIVEINGHKQVLRLSVIH